MIPICFDINEPVGTVGQGKELLIAQNTSSKVEKNGSKTFLSSLWSLDFSFAPIWICLNV